MKLKISLSMIGVVLILSGTLSGQSTVGKHYLGTDLYFSLGSSFNIDDILIDNEIGLRFIEKNWTANGLFFFRPYEKIVRIKQSDNYYRQYRAKQFGFGFTAEKQFNIANFDLFIALGPVHRFGLFRGSSIRPEGGLTVIFKSGLIRHFHYLDLKLAYRYLDIPFISSHQFSVSIIYILKHFN